MSALATAALVQLVRTFRNTVTLIRRRCNRILNNCICEDVNIFLLKLGHNEFLTSNAAASRHQSSTESTSSIERATYVRARNPKWDPVLFSPPPDLDMPGILPTARHWLVLQGKAAYLILQLDGDNWLKVLETVESRTGIKVDRTKSGGDQF